MFPNWLNRLTKRTLRSARRGHAAKRHRTQTLKVESLEDRMLMTTGPGVVFNDPSGQLHWQLLAANGAFIDHQWGGAGWSPVVGDWNPGITGHADGLGAVQTVGNNQFVWWTLSANVQTQSRPFAVFPSNATNFHFLAGYFDGSGAADYVFTYEVPSLPDIQWYVYSPALNAHFTSHYGSKGSIPVVGDWSGSGQSGIGVVDGNMNWYLRNDANPGAPAYQFQWGWAGGTVPIVGDWDGNGTVTPGLFVHGAVAPYNTNNALATWLVHNYNANGGIENGFGYGGVTGYTPVPGNWDGSGGANTAQGSNHKSPSLAWISDQTPAPVETVISNVSPAPGSVASATAATPTANLVQPGAAARDFRQAAGSDDLAVQPASSDRFVSPMPASASHTQDAAAGAVDALFAQNQDPLLA